MRYITNFNPVEVKNIKSMIRKYKNFKLTFWNKYFSFEVKIYKYSFLKFG